MTELVLCEEAEGYTRLTLNDPASRNSLSLDMMAALRERLAAAKKQVVVLAAVGPAYCAGHNLKDITAHRNDQDRGEAYFNTLFEACSDLMIDIQSHPAAVIAEVGGIASAAGCQIVASCDLAIASETSGFCTPGVNIGLFCSTPMVPLSRNVGRKHAMEMLLTGSVFSADDACRMGLVNRVVPADKLRETTDALAKQVASKSAEAIRIGKKAFAEQQGLPLREAYAAMSRVMAKNLLCEDAKEGIGAFLDKRQPTWTRN